MDARSVSIFSKVQAASSRVYGPNKSGRSSTAAFISVFACCAVDGTLYRCSAAESGSSWEILVSPFVLALQALLARRWQAVALCWYESCLYSGADPGSARAIYLEHVAMTVTFAAASFCVLPSFWTSLSMLLSTFGTLLIWFSVFMAIRAI